MCCGACSPDVGLDYCAHIYLSLVLCGKFATFDSATVWSMGWFCQAGMGTQLGRALPKAGRDVQLRCIMSVTSHVFCSGAASPCSHASDQEGIRVLAEIHEGGSLPVRTSSARVPWMQICSGIKVVSLEPLEIMTCLQQL